MANCPFSPSDSKRRRLEIQAEMDCGSSFLSVKGTAGCNLFHIHSEEFKCFNRLHLPSIYKRWQSVPFNVTGRWSVIVAGGSGGCWFLFPVGVGALDVIGGLGTGGPELTPDKLGQLPFIFIFIYFFEQGLYTSIIPGVNVSVLAKAQFQP